MDTQNENKLISNSKSLIKDWIKFLIYCFIFLICFNYTTAQIRYNNLFPLDYFQTENYANKVGDFINWFDNTTIELPQLDIPMDEITVTKQEILDAKLNSYQYNEYLYNPNTGEEIDINILTDEQIKEIIQYVHYQENQSLISSYKNSYYPESNAFYYDLTDSNGNNHHNLPNDNQEYLNIIKIPYTGKNANNFYELNNYARTYGISGTLYLPKYIMGESSIQQGLLDFIINKIIWVGSLIILVVICLPIYRAFIKIKDTKLPLPSQYHFIEEKYLKLPIEFKGLIFLGSLYVLQNIHLNIYYVSHRYLLSYAVESLAKAFIILVILYLFFLQLKGLIHHLKHPELLKKEWEQGFYMSNIDDWNNLPLYRNTFLRVTIYTCIIGVWGFIWGFSMGFYDYDAFILISLMSIIVGTILLALIKKRTKQIQCIANTLSKMAHNEVTSEIHIKGHGIVSSIAKDVNLVREGFAISTQKQTNSERLKTELITNVSHDLRTPLTSVLNYVDLAKRTDITNEERQEYLQIIDNKSKRLKVLIDDLFEASKMASGAVELNKEKVDLVALMYQALAEYEDRFESQQLVVRTKTSNQHMHSYCDGRKMYRVFENLFSNIIKYSQPATRVYIEMLYEESEIVITFKNISNYELGFDIIELAERFKRADSSRHTEGSGLGLSIVKSILELHGSGFDLSQDGDLFKVIIRISKL